MGLERRAEPLGSTRVTPTLAQARDYTASAQHCQCRKRFARKASGPLYCSGPAGDIGAVYDYAIIGGGIIGLATAKALLERHPDARIVVLEKEKSVARHQTGRNSGVIHAGVYYEPGSLKARFCQAGVDAITAFCTEHDVPFSQCGKLIVATSEIEEARLQALYDRSRENGLDTRMLTASELSTLEPNVSGLAAVQVPSSGIVSYAAISEKLAALFRANGGDLRLRSEATGLEEWPDQVEIRLRGGETLTAKQLVVCGGLQADRLARMQGLKTDFCVVPYRGKYYRLRDSKRDVVRHLIYPVPDPALPFLGVHLTPMINGTITVGPSALQGWKREGYGRFNFSLSDSFRQLRYPGFWRISRRHFRTGLYELRNAWSKRAYIHRVQKYCPTLRRRDLKRHPTGVRAMAIDRKGNMIQDFLFAETPRSLHVCSAPSPAATSAFPIAEHICKKLDERI